MHGLYWSVCEFRVPVDQCFTVSISLLVFIELSSSTLGQSPDCSNVILCGFA